MNTMPCSASPSPVHRGEKGYRGRGESIKYQLDDLIVRVEVVTRDVLYM